MRRNDRSRPPFPSPPSTLRLLDSQHATWGFSQPQFSALVQVLRRQSTGKKIDAKSMSTISAIPRDPLVDLFQAVCDDLGALRKALTHTWNREQYGTICQWREELVVVQTFLQAELQRRPKPDIVLQSLSRVRALKLLVEGAMEELPEDGPWRDAMEACYDHFEWELHSQEEISEFRDDPVASINKHLVRTTR